MSGWWRNSWRAPEPSKRSCPPSLQLQAPPSLCKRSLVIFSSARKPVPILWPSACFRVNYWVRKSHGISTQFPSNFEILEIFRVKKKLMIAPLSGNPHWITGKESSCNTGDPGSIPGSGRPPGGGNGNPFQYSCWEIPRTEEPGGLQSMGSQESNMT